MALKGQKLLQRLKKLDSNDGPMSQFMSKQRDRQDVLKKYSRDEQSTLESAVENIEGLKSKVKKQMSLVKVIDLTQKEPQKGSEEDGLDSVQLREKINYMIVKAKDQVNDAFDVLFAKDSGLNRVKDLNYIINA